MVLFVRSYLPFEASSMTSNQTPSTANPSVSHGSANFTGSGHPFGNNTQDYSTHTRHDNSSNRGIVGGGSNNTINSGANSGNQTYITRIFNSIVGNGSDANKLKRQLITTLPRAQAGRNERKKQGGPCFEGTRQALLQEIKDWATNSDESGMYVLSGLAGIGKSTVAHSVADWADEDKRLGAEFFFSRDEEDRRSAKLFFTTIAYGLCRFNVQFKQVIGEALVATDGSTAVTRSPQEQLDDLLPNPLQPIGDDLPPTLIVVDALDECDDDDARFVFTGLRRVIQALPSFKVILTTRPEALSKDDLTAKEGRKVFRLHDIDADVVKEDIRIYLNDCLSTERVNEQLPDLKTQWRASDTQVQDLVQASGKLFIMASTAVRYILDERSSDPDRQIKTLLDAFAQGRTPFDNLINFYTIILRNAIPANCDDTRLVERYQDIVGTIVLAQVPLSVSSIAILMNIVIGRISEVLHQLQSVFFIADNTPRTYHKSFVDFITDPKRCEDISLRIDPTKHHTRIAKRCFKMMGEHLKSNILGLGIPARFMSNEKGLAKDGISDEKLQKKIPLALQYACTYWDGHLNSANIDDADVVKELEKFDNERKLLPWFEVLSLIGKLDSAPHALHFALEVLKRTSSSSDLRQLLSDGLRFIQKFYQIIERSALQTYCSALLFTPTDTLLYRRYTDEALHRGCNVIGIPNQWDAVIANLKPGVGFNEIRFSLDSTMLVSRNSRGVLKVWDAVTGTPVSTIKGGGRFAIAEDFSVVASFENKAITLYNVNGNEQGVTLTTSASILEVAISSKSISRIAAGLHDGTISLWDIKDSQDGKPIGNFGDYGYRLKFSATGDRLAYLSAKYNGVVKLWDVIKGEFVADLDRGSRFAFSRDGSRIVVWPNSGDDFRIVSQKAGVKLWDCGDGQPVGTVDIERPVDTVAISDDGSLLAIGCNNSVKLWSVNRDNCLSQVEDLDLNLVSPLSFLQDDILAIPTKADVKLYSTKNRSFLSTPSKSFPLTPFSELAFSPDGSRFAVGYYDGTISLSDIPVIEPPSPSSNQQESRELTALALSRDCSRIACGFMDGTVELWETDDFPRRRINAHRLHQQEIMTLGFSPDGRQFASGSRDGTINLWDGESGVRRKELQYSPARSGDRQLERVEVSNSVLAAADSYGITLWDCKTLDCIQTSNGDFEAPLSFSADGALLAVVIIIPARFAAMLSAVAVILIASMVVAAIPVPSMLVAVAVILIAAMLVAVAVALIPIPFMLVAIAVILIVAMLIVIIHIPSTLVAAAFILIDAIFVALILIDTKLVTVSPISSILFTITVIIIGAMLVTTIPILSMLATVILIDTTVVAGILFGTKLVTVTLISSMLFAVTIVLITAMLVAAVPIPWFVDVAIIHIAVILAAVAASVMIERSPDHYNRYSITVFNVASQTVFATFKVRQEVVHPMVFLPDNSELIAWVEHNNILAFDLVSKKTVPRPSFEKFTQFPDHDMPLWDGVPVRVNEEDGQYYLEASFPQYNDPIPVLWIPRELHALEFIQRRSMIVIRCQDGRVVFLRLPTTATGTTANG